MKVHGMGEFPRGRVKEGKERTPFFSPGLDLRQRHRGGVGGVRLRRGRRLPLLPPVRRAGEQGLPAEGGRRVQVRRSNNGPKCTGPLIN